MTGHERDAKDSYGEFSLNPADFSALARIVQGETGIVLPDSKRPLMVSRLSKRLRALGLSSFGQYRALVESGDGADEIGRMITSLTTNVTRFFREGQHFDHLAASVLPALIGRARDGGRVRLWSAGCSTGEEAYSLAFTILDICPEAETLDIRILATDIDPNVLNTARTGTYPEQAVRALPAAMRNRFIRVSRDGGNEIAVADEARRLISFRELNLLRDWPFSGTFDVIMCRNVVIYFDAPTQDTLWRRFAGALPAGGRLYIGHSERVSASGRDYLEIDGITSYRRNDAAMEKPAGPIRRSTGTGAAQL